MEYRVEERIRADLDYCKDEDPIAKLQAEGWELFQLIPEYDLVECDPPGKLAQPNTSQTLEITGRLEVSSYRGVFRK